MTDTASATFVLMVALAVLLGLFGISAFCFYVARSIWRTLIDDDSFSGD